MKVKKIMISFGIFAVLFSSCEKDDEALGTSLEEETSRDGTDVPDTLEVQSFIYRGMNDIYLYKSDVPSLADSYFSTDTKKTEFLASFGSPEDLFEDLKAPFDEFSFITDDYIELENSFDGVSSSTGMQFGVGTIIGTNRVFGYLQYILPGTSAEEAGLTRGTVFTEVNGQEMTANNFLDLLDSDSFTINTGKVENGTIYMTNETVTLNDDKYTENPVYLSKIIELEGKRIGYLMYNSFIGDFDDELNDAFAEFEAEGITDLVLDLRYNGGGSVESAIDLSSMITGQFQGDIFMKEQWNAKYQKQLESRNPERLINRFDSEIRTGEAINSLELSKVYILTTISTASASELIINGLAPYIDVVQIGETTTGKFQASVTLYDSPDFNREGASENHTYAIQPLVFKSVNVAGRTDYVTGLTPDIEIVEKVGNMGILGDPSEPFLKATINHILGKPQQSMKISRNKFANKFIKIGESGMNKLNYQKMYIDQVPAVLQENME